MFLSLQPDRKILRQSNSKLLNQSKVPAKKLIGIRVKMQCVSLEKFSKVLFSLTKKTKEKKEMALRRMRFSILHRFLLLSSLSNFIEHIFWSKTVACFLRHCCLSSLYLLLFVIFSLGLTGSYTWLPMSIAASEETNCLSYGYFLCLLKCLTPLITPAPQAHLIQAKKKNITRKSSSYVTYNNLL